MSILAGLKPERVFYYFEEICRIPHGSGNTKQISDYLVAFAKEHHLSYRQDASNNVIISKNAAKGYEESPVIILQGHCDMVCEKEAGSDHDFEKDPLDLCVDGDSIFAKGTTLGGDDGIAVAYMLAILEDETLLHPALECIITTDEEIGLLGAFDLDVSELKGRKLINLDSEAEGSIWTSCAGGMSAHCEIPVGRCDASGVCCEVRISGLLGGHSGAEIDKNRANSNILLGRFLYTLEQKIGFGILDAQGGQKDNAIPRLSVVNLVVEQGDLPIVMETAQKLEAELRKEYEGTDGEICITVKKGASGEFKVLSPVSCEKLIFFLMNIANGIQKMSGSIEGLVETSCNLGIFSMPQNDDYLFAVSSVRSSVSSAKTALGEKIRYLTEFLGGEYHIEGDYPAWEYREDSPLRELMVNVYEKMYGRKPQVVAIHAGLECGLFYDRLEQLDCVSIGPDMTDIHTSMERLSISSAARVYEYLLEVLKASK